MAPEPCARRRLRHVRPSLPTSAILSPSCSPPAAPSSHHPPPSRFSSKFDDACGHHALNPGGVGPREDPATPAHHARVSHAESLIGLSSASIRERRLGCARQGLLPTRTAPELTRSCCLPGRSTGGGWRRCSRRAVAVWGPPRPHRASFGAARTPRSDRPARVEGPEALGDPILSVTVMLRVTVSLGIAAPTAPPLEGNLPNEAGKFFFRSACAALATYPGRCEPSPEVPEFSTGAPRAPRGRDPVAGGGCRRVDRRIEADRIVVASPVAGRRGHDRAGPVSRRRWNRVIPTDSGVASRHRRIPELEIGRRLRGTPRDAIRSLRER